MEHPDIQFTKGKQFFVIRGFMKSGTNWICRLLNLHPEISCTGEFHWQKMSTPLLENLDNARFVIVQEGLRHKIWMRMDQFIKESIVLANRPEAVWVGDRTPTYYEPTIVIGARVFNLIRDGRDVLISRFYHLYNYPQVFPRFMALPKMQDRLEKFRKDPSYFLANPGELLDCSEFILDTAKYWAATIEHNQRRLDENPDIQSLEVRYEQVHRDTEGVRRQLYRFLDVDPEMAEPLQFNTQPGFEREMPNRFLRKGVVGDWKNYMTPHSKKLFKDAGGEMLIKLGYAANSDW